MEHHIRSGLSKSVESHLVQMLYNLPGKQFVMLRQTQQCVARRADKPQTEGLQGQTIKTFQADFIKFPHLEYFLPYLGDHLSSSARESIISNIIIVYLWTLKT